MSRRVSETFLRDRAGKMPKHVFTRFLETGLMPGRDSDGRWSEEVVPQFDAAVRLVRRARSLERRVLLMHREGFRLPLSARRNAAASVVRTIRPGARKMTRVRRELDALADHARLGGPPARRPRTYALPLAQSWWAVVLDAAGDALWQAEWEMAARYAELLPSIARAAGLSDVEIPDEERIVLILVNLLLRHDEVRASVPLPAPVPRFGDARTRPRSGFYRRTDAPDFDELVPPPTESDR